MPTTTHSQRRQVRSARRHAAGTKRPTGRSPLRLVPLADDGRTRGRAARDLLSDVGIVAALVIWVLLMIGAQP